MRSGRHVQARQVQHLGPQRIPSQEERDATAGAGTVPRDEPNQAVPQPATITVAMIERGHQRYDIFCTPCHGLAGNSDGMIVQRGFPKPPRFTEDRLDEGQGAVFLRPC